MTQLDLNLAKSIAVSLRSAILNSGVALKDMDLRVYVVGDDDESLSMRVQGVPPFVTYEVVINGQSAGSFVGHPEVNTDTES